MFNDISSPAALAATRRSGKPRDMVAPGPDDAQLRAILEAAIRVPDHGKLAPWRLVVIEGEARLAAGEKLANLAARRSPGIDEASLDIERKRFLPAPLTIVVISAAQPHPKVPELEQVLSAGNVAFNLLHGAYALGYAGLWVTRWYAFDQEAAAVLGARPGEQIIGVISIGTPSAVIEDRPRPSLADVVSRWQA